MAGKVELVLKNTTYTTGEGPHWDERDNSLLYIDIVSGDVHKWNSVTGQDSMVHLDDTVGFAVPRRSGGYVVGLGRTLSVLDWDSQKTTVLHEVPNVGTKDRFNDGKCDASGRIWAGTMGHEAVPSVPETEKGCLFSLDRDGTIKTHLEKINISNGLAWTDDNQTMYYIDSHPRKVYAFDFDINAGSISNQRVAVDFGEGTVDTLGFPDGCCIDNEGKLWVACYSVGKVIRFDPETGKELQTINFPVKRTTSCCFGGPNYDELYVTSGKFGMSEEEFKTNQPLAGSVFKVTGLGVKGKPIPMYEA